MSNQTPLLPNDSQIFEETADSKPMDHRRRGLVQKSLVLLLVFIIGLGSGYLIGHKTTQPESTIEIAAAEDNPMALMMHQINPPEGYQIPAVFGDIGPQLIEAGAINMPIFIDLYQRQNNPLTDEQMSILTKETASKVVINPENAYFLLNFFWALGLTNQNPILTEGPLMSGGMEKVGSFASTGGWTIGTKQPIELYASQKIITLTDEQQARLLEVASEVYRPCCNNPTHFPDCNHGMAMLGLLELMAAQNASSEDMFETAKYVTAFWYPQQMLEVATVFKATQNVDFVEADARQVVSNKYSSGSGFQSVHQWLVSNGLLQQAPSSGGSCGVQ
ncbi:MAG: hypothetical protein A2Y88_09715 [Chloroflexi bacterium RBG_13_48_10]|nr:MAG: hypothetical protein A2Y88_09715 [Chloroflexi bacterium RBG_13_48_10]